VECWRDLEYAEEWLVQDSPCLVDWSACRCQLHVPGIGTLQKSERTTYQLRVVVRPGHFCSVMSIVIGTDGVEVVAGVMDDGSCKVWSR
jgi:hypothetical protein